MAQSKATTLEPPFLAAQASPCLMLKAHIGLALCQARSLAPKVSRGAVSCEVSHGLSRQAISTPYTNAT
jgi:hypothetical protein